MVNLKASYTVKPAEQTRNGLMYLSECDQVKAITHAPTIYLYRRPATEVSLDDAIQTLRDSLSKALVYFYPLAGRLYSVDGGRFELHCNSTGVELIAAESNGTIDDFGDFSPSPKYGPFLPSVDYDVPINELPLLIVQLTKFSCGGMSLGVKISHIIVDGQSALHFIGEWARIARGGKIRNPPFLDRSVLKPKDPLAKPKFEHPELKPPPLLLGQSDNQEERKKPTTVAVLKLSKKQVERLRSKANEKAAGDVNGRPFSRYESVSSHIWRCLIKARGHANEQQSRLNVAVDFRNRLQPPLPPYYFGNTIFRAMPTATAGELLSKPLGCAALKIRESVQKFDEEYVKSYLLSLLKIPDVFGYRNFHTAGCSKGAFYGNPNLEITSWFGLPLYGADFGWGKEIHMGPPSIGFDGKSFIVPSREEEGSFAIAICIQKAHMDAFQKYLYQDI